MSGSSEHAGFVGRERELARIAARLEMAAAGERATVLLSGAGGIGVTRLVDETANRVGRLAKPFTVIRARAYGGRSGEPFAPLVVALDTFLGGLTDDELVEVVGPSGASTAALVPLIRSRLERLGLLNDQPLLIAPERRLAWMAEGVLGLLDRAGERSPVLLTLEDLHVADAATRSVAVFVSRVLRPSRLCVVMTYADDALARGHPLLDDLAAINDAGSPPERITLAPLGRDELADLIAASDGSRPTAATVLLVTERSRGVPLVAVQVQAARRELAGVSLGSTIDELVAARLAIRSPECRRVLRLVAPAEEPLPAARIARIAAEYERTAQGLPPRSTSGPRRGAGGLDADLRAGLEEAVAAGFVVIDERGDYGVPNEVVASAIVADLLPGQRRRLHAALAAALADRPAAAMRHWQAAREPVRARDAALAAAESPAASGAPRDALAAIELALELGAADGGDRATAGRLLVRAADISAAAERPARALAYLESALGSFTERVDGVELAGIHERLGRVRRALGDHEGALAEHRHAASLVARAAPIERVPVIASLAQVLMLDGWFDEAETRAREALELARACGPEARAWEGHALTTLGIVRAWGDQPAEATPLLEAGRKIARELGRTDDAFRAAANLSTAMSLQGRWQGSISTAMAAIDEVRRIGLESTYGNALRGNVGEALFFLGRWAEARSVLRTALEWSASAEAFTQSAVALAALEVESAADETAARILGRLLLDLRRAPDRQSEVPASRVAASFALWRGDVADAGRAADLAWRLVGNGGDWVAVGRTVDMFMEVQAALVADAHERRDLATLASARQRAETVLTEATRILSAVGAPPGVASRDEADAHLATARAYAARLDGEDRAVVWDAVARTWERLGDPYQVARARWRQAEAVLATADGRSGRLAARKPLREAATIAADLGAGPLLRELRELARRAMIQLPAEVAIDTQVAGDVSGGTPAVPTSTSPASGALDGTSANGEGGIASAFAEPGPARRRDAFGLSSREREVLALIVDGRTNREIGERLFISQKTVGVHVGNILAKLGASGRVEAAMVAVRLALVPTR
jgi:DNA-binding CsgD family transcriptional regulator/tetratricopeptide (TPR) repeat protein